MKDETEESRRLMATVINVIPGSREDLEFKYGQVWDTDQLITDFTVIGFMSPYVLVRRCKDGREGTLMFQHKPRFYFWFQE